MAVSAYSGVRFLGGAIAPAVAEPPRGGDHRRLPYLLAALALALSMAMLTIDAAPRAFGQEHHLSAAEKAEAITAGDEV